MLIYVNFSCLKAGDQRKKVYVGGGYGFYTGVLVCNELNVKLHVFFFAGAHI